MALLPRVVVVLVAFGAVIYQLYLKRFLFTTMGVGRAMEPLSSFNYTCERISDVGLEACEDMWIHQPTGLLFLSCGDSQARTNWFPAIDSLNASGRSLTDKMAVLDTRGKGSIASRLKWIDMENFSGINGDGTITMHGIDVREIPNSNKLKILLVNHRPPVDPATGEFLDSTKIGANSTLEVFEMTIGGDSMTHVKTYADEAIQMPNRAQWVDDNSFVFTNDHDRKIGLLRNLEAFTGGGSVGYCDPKGCKIIKDKGFYNPNGIGVGHDGLVYVPNTVTGDLNIFTLNSSRQFEEVATVKTGYPLDNLHIERNGDVYAAAFPQMYKLMASGKQPFALNPPAMVLKIRREDGAEEVDKEGKSRKTPSWVVEKVLEDDGSVLPGATVAVHDELMDSIFVGGVCSPFIAICKSKK
ncbi:hypothetical protein F5884DRAFT_805042 [Xylogone sp. PMI_703]|nr:hypothetical protein F5884DRAFT_805042 [Xylogone sp. PMI_703]